MADFEDEHELNIEGRGPEPFDDEEEEPGVLGGDEDPPEEEPEQSEEEPEHGEDQPQRRTPGRRERAVLNARQQAAEARERAERAERELQELRQRQMQPTREQQEREAERERERLALMGPDEKMQYLLEKQSREMNHRFALLQAQQQDAHDRQMFERLCSQNRAFETIRTEVEQKVAELRGTGVTVTREAAAKYLLGEKVAQRAVGAKARQRSAGERRIAEERGRPGGGQGDVAESGRSSRDSKAARNKRLEGMTI